MTEPCLAEARIADFMDAIHAERGDADWRRLAGFMRDVIDGTRSIWTARQNGAYVGLITVRWQSDYGGFRVTPHAPEIIDLYVWHHARRQGVAAHLLRHAEDAVRQRHYTRLGLGVGILAEDMPAWALYMRHGYTFDGTGAWWQGTRVMDDSVINHTLAPVLLMMDKAL